MNTVALPATTLTYDDIGPADDAPMLLVHGHPFDRTMWHPQLATFASRRVIVPDLRGYGASTGAVTAWTDFADDLVGLLDALRVPRAVVVGLSMGGQIALDLYRRHPDRVLGLLLADTSATGDPDVAGRRAAAQRLLDEGMDPFAVDNLYRLIRPGTPAEVAEHVLAMIRETTPAGAAAAQFARADRPDLRGMLAEVTVPTTVVVGAEDGFTPPAEAADIAGRIPGAELVVIEGAAHLPNLEHPAAFDGAIDRLLTRVRSTAAAA